MLLYWLGSINSFRSNCLILRFKNEQINNRCHDAIQMISGDDDNQAISSSTQQQLSSSSPASVNVNVKLDNVKNMRDISTVRTSSSYIKPNKVIRTGCVSRASENDVSIILSFHTLYYLFIIALCLHLCLHLSINIQFIYLFIHLYLNID